jgi:hypothetical protein
LFCSLFYFLQYAGLGLYKLRKETELRERPLDALRLMFASALLMGVVYALLDGTDAGKWMGGWFLGYSFLHVVLAWIGYRYFPHFTHEVLAFLAGATLFAALALPVQLQGEWISLGWALQGVILAWMARRMGSRFFQTLAVVLGLVGIIKVLAMDAVHYESQSLPLMNLRFWVGGISAALFSLQGYLLRGNEGAPEQTRGAADGFWWVAFLALLAIGVSDVLWTVGADRLAAWSAIAWILLLTGAGIHFAIPAGSSVRTLGTLLFWLVPMVLAGSSLLLTRELRGVGCFSHGWVWLHLLTVTSVAAFVLHSQRRLSPSLDGENADIEVADQGLPASGAGMMVLSIASGIVLVSNELFRALVGWGSMAVSLFWGASAVALILFGLKLETRVFRRFGLLLFALCAAKVILVDSTQLSGLYRIGAYIGSGILLLLLSLLYQKAAAHFKSSLRSS